MNKRTAQGRRHKMLAGMHLVVYLAAFLLATFHVHKIVDSTSCLSEISFVQDTGTKATNDASHCDSCTCPLCHFLTILFSCEAGNCDVAPHPLCFKQAFFCSEDANYNGYRGHTSPRAPPFSF